MAARLELLKTWLADVVGMRQFTIEVASADASFRRYFRVLSEAKSYIVMDAPPAQEDSRPFIRVAGYLEAMALNAPRVLEANLDDGFLLLSDLGNDQYLKRLEQDEASPQALYDDALPGMLS